MLQSLVSRRRFLLLLLAAAVVPYFVGLGDSSIWDANEAFYVETPREMIETGDYINPSFNYEPRFNKPVLSYWIVAAFYQLFGISVGVQRLPMAMGALALVAAAFAAGRAVRSTETGLWSALVLATSPRLLMFARRIFIDMYITLFMGLTLVFFMLAERHPERRKRYLLLMYAAVGLGMLTKGPVAIVLPGLVFLIWLAFQRRLGDVPRMYPAWGVLIVLAIVAPWYIALYAQHGWQHIVGFFWGENVARYTDAVAPERGLLFYAPVVLGDTFPWSLLLVPAAFMTWRMGGRDQRGRLLVLLWVWLASIALFFTLSATKQDLYIFPVILASAVLSAYAMTADVGDRASRVRRWTLAAAGAVMVVVGLFVYQLFGAAHAMYQLAGVRPIVLATLAGGLMAAMLAIRRQEWHAGITLAATMVVLGWTFVLWTLPSFERYKPIKPLSETIASRAGADAAVLHYNVAAPSMVFYLGRHVDQFYDNADPMLEKMRGLKEYYLVTLEQDYQMLRPWLPGRSCLLERRPLFDVKLRNVLAREPLPQIVLVTNRCRE
jgi:4-amino-4-deoxy-L-arabinose transferase-like glycosyltransferase